MRILALQHVAFENVSLIGEWAQMRGHELDVMRLDQWRAGQALPSDFDMLVAMGGPMSANDEPRHPWLVAEKQWIRDAIAQQKYVLGICLGAQLIASALGVKVYPNPVKEIGWFPVTIEAEARSHPLLSGLPLTMNVFHWHGETFDLPENARRLMASTHCKNQVFSYGDKVLGLQFHLEMAESNIAAIITHCAEELTGAPTIQTAAQMQNNPHRIAQCEQALYHLLDQLTNSVP